MATRDYIITLDDSELTDELCTLLERLGARLAQDSEPVLTSADKRVLHQRIEALESGEAVFLDIKDVFDEIRSKQIGT